MRYLAAGTFYGNMLHILQGYPFVNTLERKLFRTWHKISASAATSLSAATSCRLTDTQYLTDTQ
ncbi:hypothetical protein LCGC14_2711480 [marine sediment metagenome]|uniref:Uncharacterized protein n=1 Tax=marine sediment metagenome TaxID=412755 RepID=A0A0F9A0J9_9ZZZZ